MCRTRDVDVNERVKLGPIRTARRKMIKLRDEVTELTSRRQQLDLEIRYARTQDDGDELEVLLRDEQQTISELEGVRKHFEAARIDVMLLEQESDGYYAHPWQGTHKVFWEAEPKKIGFHWQAVR